MSTYPFHFSRALARALTTVVVITFVVLVIGLSSAAFGANPAEEMAKVGTTDPKGDSWQAIQHSLEQFAHPEFMLRLFLSLGLAVACAYAIAWHPRRSSLANPLADLEERKTLILLGMVGAIVAELSGSSQTLAFVIFGIGALLRFRTVLDNPKLVGKAITVVVVGLACGMVFAIVRGISGPGWLAAAVVSPGDSGPEVRRATLAGSGFWSWYRPGRVLIVPPRGRAARFPGRADGGGWRAGRPG